jgi:hypothetical protein
MPRIGYFLAATVGVVAAFAFSGIAGASHTPGHTGPTWSCRASVARVAFPPNSLPVLEPLVANTPGDPCVDDAAGLPTIDIPPAPSPQLPSPAPPIVSANALFARTEVTSRAGAADVAIRLGQGAQALNLRAVAASSRTDAFCSQNARPSFESESRVVGVTINDREITIPGETEQTMVDLAPLPIQVIFNERLGTEGEQQAGATEGALGRRAIHVILRTGSGPQDRIDVVVGESIADFHGTVCQRVVSAPGPECPAGTTRDPVSGACVEAPRGGRLVPLSEVPGHAGSPCRNPRFGRSVAILGTNGPDRITGTNLSDRIFALAGSDRVSGGRGDDCVEGDSGKDILDGSNGNDYLLGGSGNDVVSGGPGRDRLEGGSGGDRLSGGVGSDVIRGAGGNDKIQGGFGNDRILGGAGNDGIHTGNGRDRVFAGPGNDIINAATRGPAAFVDCGPGRDRVRINNNERRRIRNCEFVDVFHRIRSG